MNKALFFINGEEPSKIPQNINEYSLIACTDGAYSRYVYKFQLKIDFISGDFDSLIQEQVPQGITLISTPDQNKTDFHKALELLVERRITQVDVYGATGRESDHFIGNLSTALYFKNKLKITFYDDYSKFFFSNHKTHLTNVKGKIISLIPFFKAENIQTQGLQYPLNNEPLCLPERIGTRNKAIDECVTIEYSNGELLIYISNS
ncbi:thiamine diphosphokinase [Apibacter muscae]|uniref:Thiamine diphosphokinase n=1 Tax=Apibacter muscae TaxID=2509004 RepID=A0A563DEY1_9FLAO|nr:thiamine diphosphokinase [Apibacter muscae]TWP28314.1 thiamine diphosphokinase [Apibacter muscae]TWP30737.1 thiamine diphosphokinase [Apibacter muscae]